ncbi:MAG: hypothetical protein AAB581_00475 [Patescibacteria group bacterium]
MENIICIKMAGNGGFYTDKQYDNSNNKEGMKMVVLKFKDHAHL